MVCDEAKEGFGFDSKGDGKPWEVLGRRRTGFNLNNPSGCWVEDGL